MCVVKLFLGIPCPGCGLMHALWAALHFRFSEAFHLFPIWPAVILFLILRRQKYAGSVFVLLLFSQWMVRIWLLHTT